MRNDPVIPARTRSPNRRGPWRPLVACLLLATFPVAGALLARPGPDPSPSSNDRASATASVTLELIEGGRTGRLAENALDRDARTLVLESGSIPIRDVLRIRFRTPNSLGRTDLVLRLADGSRVRGALLESSDPDVLRLKTPSLDATVSVPIEWVREIGRGTEVLEGENEQTSDSVETASGASIRGVIETIGPRGVEIEDPSLGKLELPWNQVRRVRVAPLDPTPTIAVAELPCYAETDDGCRFHGALRALGTERLELESPLIGAISIPAEARTSIELLLDRVAYLSDRTPIAVDEGIPTSDYFPWTWKRDRNVLGDPMRIGSETFRKGLGVHARSALTFAIEPGDQVLRARVGIDVAGRPVDDDPRVGSVRFVVLVDDTEAYRSGDIGWADPPTPIEVPLAGHEKVTLLVEMGIGHHVLDRANWGDARILRR